LSLALFAGIPCFAELGRYFGRRRVKKNPDDSAIGFPAVEGSVFALMGLLIAFTFSGAASRYESRRQLIVQETNSIASAWLRIDLLPAARQEALRQSFKSYLDLHLDTYRAMPNIKLVQETTARARNLQREIWAEAVVACREAPSPATAGLVLPAFSGMFELMETRIATARTHLPSLICALLIILPLLCALLAGLSSASRLRRSWTQILGFAAILSVTVFVILDLEYPRVGFIRLDEFDQAQVELRKSM
jgi:hypothetical protein